VHEQATPSCGWLSLLDRTLQLGMHGMSGVSGMCGISVTSSMQAPWTRAMAGWMARGYVGIAKALAQHHHSSAIALPAALRGLKTQRQPVYE
jgi:hypothetical protein